MLLRRQHPLTASQVGAIVISPTRELATQIFKVFSVFVQHLPSLTLMRMIGGVTTANEDRRHFSEKGGHIIVATPGRLEDLLYPPVNKRRVLDVSDLDVLVLDEADRLLYEGFETSLTRIIRKLPKQRRTGLFSATQTKQVKDLIRAGLRNPVQINVNVHYKHKAKAGEQEQKPGDASRNTASAGQKSSSGKKGTSSQIIPTSLSNWYQILKPTQKLPAMLKFLTRRTGDKTIIFLLTCACVDYFHKVLAGTAELHGLSPSSIKSLHGKMPSKKRIAAVKEYTALSSGVLICTDVAARGIDIPDVDWILQFDPPQDPSFFVHRIGRTARAGRSGQAMIYLMPKEDTYIDYLNVEHVPIAEWKDTNGGADPDQDKDTDKVTDKDSAVGAGDEADTTVVADKSLDAAVMETGTDSGASEEKEGDGEDDGVSESDNRVLQAVRDLALADRDIMEKGQKALVSFFRAYKEHKCNFIFVFNQLAFADVAEGYGLLYFPFMADLKHFNIKYKQMTTLKPHQIKFKQQQKEKVRLANMVVKREKRQKEKEEREKLEKERREQKKKAEPKRRRKRKNKEMKEEWDDLQNEARLLKKLKQGKITQREYEIAVGEREEDSFDETSDHEAQNNGDGGSNSNGNSNNSKEPEAPVKKKKKKKNKKKRKKNK